MARYEQFVSKKTKKRGFRCTLFFLNFKVFENCMDMSISPGMAKRIVFIDRIFKNVKKKTRKKRSYVLGGALFQKKNKKRAFWSTVLVFTAIKKHRIWHFLVRHKRLRAQNLSTRSYMHHDAFLKPRFD